MNNVALGLSNFFTGFLLMLTCWPLVKRKIGMNKWYGIRVSKAFASEENWYAINEYGGRQFMYWSLPIMLIGIATLFLPPMGAETVLLAALSPLVLLVPVIKIFVFSKKI